MAIVGDKVKLSNYSYQLNPDGTDFDQSLIDKIESAYLRRPYEKVLDAVDIDWRPYKIMDYSDENNPSVLYAPGELANTSQVIELLAYAYSASKQALHADKSDEADHAYMSSYVSHIEINHLGLAENSLTSGQLLAVNSLLWDDKNGYLSYNTTHLIGKNSPLIYYEAGEIFNDYINNRAGSLAHAEGDSTIAFEYASHSEGSLTYASGIASHAEGTLTVTYGHSSHAEGQYTIANNDSEHASGIYNNSISYIENSGASLHEDDGDILYDDDPLFSTENDYLNFYNTIFTIGNGESLQTGDVRHNAFEVRKSGDIFISNVNKPGEYYRKPMIHLQHELANKADHDEVNNIIGLKDAFRFAGAFTPNNTNLNNKPTSATNIAGIWTPNDTESVYKRILKWEDKDNKQKSIELSKELVINGLNDYKIIINDKIINDVIFSNEGDGMFSYESNGVNINYDSDETILEVEYSEAIINFSLFIKDSKTGEVWKVTRDGWFGNKFIHAGDMLLSCSDKATQDNTEHWVVIESHISYLDNSGTIGGFTATNITESNAKNLYLGKFISNINISDDGKLSYTYSDITFTQKADSDFITSIIGDIENGTPEIRLNSSKFATAYTTSTLESLNGYLTVVSSLEFDNTNTGQLNYNKTDIPVELLESVWEKGEDNGAQLKYGNNIAVSYSVAGGENSTATGKDSLAIGTNVTSGNDSEASLGKFNYTNRPITTSGDKTIFTVGNGILNNLHNAIEVRNSGSIYIPDIEVESGEYYQKPMILLQEALTRTKIQQVSWSELVNLKASSKLKPGSYYQITDYADSQYDINYIAPGNTEPSYFVFSGNRFDIIVLATSNNTLSEDAKAEYHSQIEGDYFFSKKCKLHSWKLKYCLENDTNRFAWADTRNGKGVIYHMIDEHNNEAPYDFKNILMWRYYIQPQSTYRNLLDNLTGKFLGVYPAPQYGIDRVGVTSNPNAGYALKYTFNDGDTQFNKNTECSVYPEYNVYNNVIKPYYFGDKQYLNDITFDCDKVDASISCHNNIFAENCRYMACGKNCFDNTFDIGCNLILFGDNNTSNIFKSDCYKITLSGKSSSNTFGPNNFNILSNVRFMNNILNNSCYNIHFGTNCLGNTFGNECNNIYMGESCIYNEFGNNCYHIALGNFTNLSSPDFIYDNTSSVFAKYIKVDDGVSFISLNSNYAASNRSLMNIHVLRGVHGGSRSGNSITVNATYPKLNVSFANNELDNDYELLVGMNSKGRLCKWINEPFGATVTLVSGGNRNIADIPANII